VQSAEAARSLARAGRSQHFRDAVAAGALPAPLARWAPALPPAARTELFAWAERALADSANCFLVLFRDCTLDAGAGPAAQDHARWRSRVANDGVPGVRRLIASYLVHPASTRKLLREMAAFGDFCAASGRGGNGGASLAAAALKAAAARRAWVRQEERRPAKSAGGAAEDEGSSEGERSLKATRGY